MRTPKRQKKKPSRGGRQAAAAKGRVFTLAEVARELGGEVFGDPATRLTGLAPLERAADGDLSWVADARRAKGAAASHAGALLVSDREAAGGKPGVLVKNPAAAMAAFSERLFPPSRPKPGVERGAFVSPKARLGKGVAIAAGASVAAGARIGDRTILHPGARVGEDATVGADCVLYPNAVVRDRCAVGDRCILHAGAVIGADGFGYVWDGEAQRKIPQRGIVRLEDDVEIGANSAVDRATFGETVVGRGTKIDNLVQIGHNCVVAEHVILCAQVGLAGSSRVGRRAVLAGQVGVNDHVTIGEGAVMTGQTGVTADAPAGAVLSGVPEMPHRQWLRSSALFARLPELSRRLEDLARRLERLEKGGGG
ncbi:MAG TPA: UDP-3-O-(3-hydroxymyristoyl)glucosamine N-acyltransferase [Thermoanaerobaculia bacterium]